MGAWASAHPYLTFFLALSALNVVGFLLSPPCEGWRALSPGCQQPPQTTSGLSRWPTGNGVYHGLVRRS